MTFHQSLKKCSILTPQSRAVVFQLFQKNGYPPSKSGRFSVNLHVYPIVRHSFHPICINLLELNTKLFIFFSCTVQGFCTTNKPISTHYL